MSVLVSRSVPNLTGLLELVLGLEVWPSLFSERRAGVVSGAPNPVEVADFEAPLKHVVGFAIREISTAGRPL